ncbi:hypothetical protein Areg01_50600 [Actinoplanes regularis]|nr:hypothetical protein Areg01_50600 [Actinoplanes regularis]
MLSINCSVPFAWSNFAAALFIATESALVYAISEITPWSLLSTLVAVVYASTLVIGPDRARDQVSNLNVIAWSRSGLDARRWADGGGTPQSWPVDNSLLWTTGAADPNFALP